MPVDGRWDRNMKITILSALILSLAIGIGCDKPAEPEAEPLPALWAAPTFELTNQDGKPFGSKDLAGKTWIATLFFTTCPGPCPMMAGRLREIQEAVQDPNVLIVSISCDPENDTVAKLKDYAEVNQADPTKWCFLTGPYDQVKAAADTLKLGFDRATATEPISHSTKFLLIDKTGTVRGVYTHDDPESMKQLKLDAPKLARVG